MKWNNSNDRFDSNGGNGRGSFQEHNESMREFRKSHGEVAMINGPRCDEYAFLESMKPLRVCRTMVETGGSQILTNMTDWSALVPTWRVMRYKLSQN